MNEHDLPRARFSDNAPAREEEIGNAESVVDQAYKRLSDYSTFAQKNIAEAKAKLEHWEQEYRIVQAFLAKDQSDKGREKARMEDDDPTESGW